MDFRINIVEVNSLDNGQFEDIFGNVVELCPDAAAQVRKRRPFDSLNDFSNGFNKYLDDLKMEEKVTILKLHPDLAGRLAAKGELTRESAGEQRSAGLDKITEEQRKVIETNNERYKSKFGFPFIICARENKVQSIIEGLQTRYNNTRDKEIMNGIHEVKKICKLRLKDLVKDD